MDVDVKLLEDYNLTPNQYILIYLTYKKEYTNFNKVRQLLDVNEELKEAERKGFIKVKGDNIPENITIRNKFLFILGEGDYFDEIIAEYPVKVIRPDGIKDYLRTDLKRCRRNYSKITNDSKKKHERILEALRYEKKVREKEDSWKYMKKLPKWLTSEEWKTFEERMQDERQENKDSDLGYGHTIR